MDLPPSRNPHFRRTVNWVLSKRKVNSYRTEEINQSWKAIDPGGKGTVPMISVLQLGRVRADVHCALCGGRCDNSGKTGLLLELAFVLVLVDRSETVRQDCLQHVDSHDESFQPHGHLPRKTLSALSGQSAQNSTALQI